MAPQAVECSSVANSDVKLQIKMDLTVVHESRTQNGALGVCDFFVAAVVAAAVD